MACNGLLTSHSRIRQIFNPSLPSPGMFYPYPASPRVFNPSLTGGKEKNEQENADLMRKTIIQCNCQQMEKPKCSHTKINFIIAYTTKYLQHYWLRGVQYWPYFYSVFIICTLWLNKKNITFEFHSGKMEMYLLKTN